MVKLIDEKIGWSINQAVKKGGDAGRIAAIYGILRRRTQQLVKTYKKRGKYPTLSMERRPRVYLTDEEKRMITKVERTQLKNNCTIQ